MSSENLYDLGATRAAIHAAGLAPRGRKFIATWLSAWQGGRLPSPTLFHPKRLQSLQGLVMVCAVKPDVCAKIIFVGEQATRIVGKKLIDLDWLSLISTEYLPERVQRTASVAEGAILRTVRQVTLDQGAKYSFEVISVPLQPDSDGTIPVFTFFDWAPPDKMAVPRNLREITKPPVCAEFITIVRSRSATSPLHPPTRELEGELRIKMTSQAAARFVMNYMREAMRVSSGAGLDPTDYLIALAIDIQNLAHIQNDPNISHRYAGLVEPDWMRRGISRAAVSRTMYIPLETVRRRINRLIDKGILRDRQDGIVLAPGSRPETLLRISKTRIGAQLVEQLFADLRARGIVLLH